MNSPPTSASKRRSLNYQPSSEDQQFNIIALEAESRDANKHAVLAEARKIRTNERERLRQAEEGNEEDDEDERCNSTTAVDNNHDEHADGEHPSQPATSLSPPMPQAPATPVAVPKRLLSDEISANGAPVKISRPAAPVATAAAPMSSSDLEERYKRVMMTNAQLDNDKQVLQYEVELFKDRLVDAEERFIEFERQHASTCRELVEQKSIVEEWKTKCKNLQDLLSQRDALIKEHGLLFITVGEPDVVPASSTAGPVSSALLSVESAELLLDYEGSLGERLAKFFQDKIRLEEENKRLQRDLESEKSRAVLAPRFTSDGISVPGSPSISGMDGPMLDVETQKNITEYKLKLKRAEQEILTLQGSVTRLECQVNRYKSAAETSEKSEEELKQEKRKLLKELREAQNTVQELETKNGHLMKRMEKAKYRNVSDAN